MFCHLHSRGQKKGTMNILVPLNVDEKKKHQKSFHKGWFIPNEVLQRIFFTWPAKTVFVPKKWPSTYQVIMRETVSEVCEGDIPSYYPLFPNRLFYPFVDQLHCKFTVLTLLHLYRTDDCWKTFCTVLCHTQITEYTFKMHEIKNQPFKALLHRESF